MKFNKFLLLSILFIGLATFSCGDEDDEFINDDSRNEGLVAVYEVNGNQLNLIEAGEAAEGFYNSSRQNQLWTFITNLIPLSARTSIVEWEFYADGNDDTAAFVLPMDDNDLSEWLMGHNLDIVWDFQGNFVFGETAYTSIHEIAHVITLDDTQVDEGGSATTCNNFFPGEGCSKTNSYINQFFQTFWTDIYAESQQIDEEDLDGIDAFYDKYSDQFVTHYAATNPGEDIAESFSYFMMQDDIPTGDAIQDQKVRFWQDYPEMVSLRQQIRANIDFTFDLDQINAVRAERWNARKLAFQNN